MAYTKTERPKTVIKAIVAPINAELKTKIAIAFQEVVTKIKQKHL